MLPRNILKRIILSELLISFWSVAHSEDSGVKKAGKIIFAHVMFRHGDRTPRDPYPNDPYRTPEAWDQVKWGQLTNLGIRQHFELGKWLRNRYQDLVSETYNPNEVYVQSTDHDRTLQSALSNLAGFYPPKGRDVWNKEVAWQPIPVHTIPEDMDNLLAARKSCPAYEYALNEKFNSDEYRELNKKFENLYNYLSKKTGQQISCLRDVQNIYNCLLIESLHNKTLPVWTETVFPGDMAWISAKTFATSCSTPQMARLKSGPILKEILQRFRNKIEGSLRPNRSIWIYSAHDYTVANLLNILRLFDPPHNPPFTACIMMEMRLIDHQPYISVFYKNTTGEPEALNIPHCGSSCPLAKMFALYENLLPTDWESECNLPLVTRSHNTADYRSSSSFIVAPVIASFSIAFLLVLLNAIIKRRRFIRQYATNSVSNQAGY